MKYLALITIRYNEYHLSIWKKPIKFTSIESLMFLSPYTLGIHHPFCLGSISDFPLVKCIRYIRKTTCSHQRLDFLFFRCYGCAISFCKLIHPNFTDFAVFEPYKDNKVDLLGPKLLFIALNLGGLALGVWKVSCSFLFHFLWIFPFQNF